MRKGTSFFFLPLDRLAAVLLVAKRSQIIANRINMRPPQIRPVISGSSIVAVDFDRITSRIYWADASQKKIWSAYQNGTGKREVRGIIARREISTTGPNVALMSRVQT